MCILLGRVCPVPVSIKALIVGSGLGMVYQCKSLELLLRSVCVSE